MALLGNLPASTVVLSASNLTISNVSANQSLLVSAYIAFFRLTNISANITVDAVADTGYTIPDGNILTIVLENDASLARVITWGTHMDTLSGTLVGTASKKAICGFTFSNGLWLQDYITLALT